jgi:mRNA interferase MazF
MEGNQKLKIDLEKAQHIIDWVKTQLYLDTRAEKAKNRIVHRGEVYLCNFGIGIGSEMQKERPGLIIQGNVGNINSSNVIVAPITHTDKPIPSMAHISTQFDENGNIILDGQVNLSNIQTVSKARLGNFITKLSDEDMSNVDNSLYVSLGLMKNIKKYEDRIESLNKYIAKLRD